MAKHYINEEGTDIILDTGLALATATITRIKYQKPDGTTGYWAGSVVDSTKVSYTLAEGVLDQAGVWLLQAYVEFADWKGHGETVELVVYSEKG